MTCFGKHSYAGREHKTEKPSQSRVWQAAGNRPGRHRFQFHRWSRPLSLQSNAEGLICRNRKVLQRQQIRYL